MRSWVGLSAVILAVGCLSDPSAPNPLAPQATGEPPVLEPPWTIVRPGSALELRTNNSTEFRLRFAENVEVAAWSSHFYSATGIALWYPIGGLATRNPCRLADDSLFLHGPGGYSHEWALMRPGGIIPAGDYRAIMHGENGSFLRMVFHGDPPGNETLAQGIPPDVDSIQGWVIQQMEERTVPFSLSFAQSVDVPPRSLVVTSMEVLRQVGGPVSTRSLSLAPTGAEACARFEATEPSVWTPAVGFASDAKTVLPAVVEEGGNFTLAGKFEAPIAAGERHQVSYWIIRLE